MRKIHRDNFIKSKILEYINDNSKLYILMLIVFFMGLSIGIIFINNIGSECKQQIVNYINEFCELFKSENAINVNGLVTQLVYNDIITIILLFFLGCTILGFPLIYLLILYKGFCLGYTISALTLTLGGAKTIIIAIFIIISYAVYIPAIISTAVNGINVYKKIISNRREEKLKVIILRHLILCVIMLILMIAMSVLESYILAWTKPIITKFI